MVALLPGWQLSFAGWPWWLAAAAAALAVVLLVRLHRRELATIDPRAARRLLALRGTALAILICFLAEPAVTRRTSERTLPRVAVIVDQSGSMAVRDEMMPPGAKLAEAIGLGLLPPSTRPLKTNAVEQAASDQAVVKGAATNSPVTAALAELATMNRYQRAVRLARSQVLPLLNGRARVSCFGLDTTLVPLDLENPATLLPNRATDFEAALASLARDWSRDYVGGIVLISDGRQTAGGDPAPVIRSFRARGAPACGILAGDPGVPPDAVLADLSGSSEVFLGENTLLTVRYRISGADELDWDLVLSRGQREIERRTVRGNGQWQYQTFSFPATNAGVNLYQARLELAGDQSGRTALEAAGTVNLEIWRNIPGIQVSDLVDNAAFKRAPSATVGFSQLNYSGRGESYGARLRGFLIPPQSGNYTFWIASDDSSELWLSPTDDPAGKVRIAQVAGFVPRGEWENQAAQKSQPVTLRARQPCYFEVLHKQGSGEDHLAVGWRLPDGTTERPIPGTRLAPFDESTRSRIAALKRDASQARTNGWREASLANNSAGFSVTVNQDPIKVLLVDSTPRWESRYLAAMFERDRRVNLTRRYHSVQIEDRNSFLLPATQAGWDAFDMVCLGDLDGSELPPEQQTRLARFVSHRGGFLVCLAGPRGMPRAFSLGPVADLLPVRPGVRGGSEGGAAAVALTKEGAEHPVMQVLNDPGYNAKLWPLLPPLQWVADSVVAKPGAAVLLRTSNPAQTPVVAIQRFGAGRVFWVGTEETWRWRDRLGERVHQTFWLQAMRWGLAGRVRGKDPSLQVGLDRYLMAATETAELKVRAGGADGEPSRTPPAVRLDQLDATGQPVAGASRTPDLELIAGVPGLWHLGLTGLPEGTWRITVSHPGGGSAALEETRDLVVRDSSGAEGLELGGDLPALARMSAAGGGEAGTMDQTARIVKDLAARLQPRSEEHQETIRLWNNYFILCVIVGLLSAEWILRKRQGLA